MTPDQFLDVLFTVIRDSVKQYDQRHPEDIMTTVTLVADTIYNFVSACPTGTFKYPLLTDG